MEPRKLSNNEISNIVRSVSSLNAAQRSAVKDALMGLARSADGKVSEQELKRELYRLRQAGAISELDAKGVAKAVFDE